MPGLLLGCGADQIEVQGILSGLLELFALPRHIKDINCFVRLRVDHEHVDIAASVAEGGSEIVKQSGPVFPYEIDQGRSIGRLIIKADYGRDFGFTAGARSRTTPLQEIGHRYCSIDDAFDCLLKALYFGGVKFEGANGIREADQVKNRISRV